MTLPRLVSPRPLLALAALVLLALPARAQFVLDDGQGHAVPTGGTRNQTQGPPPPYRHGPYAYTNGSYGLQGVSGGTVTLSGECVFHYRWAGPAGTAPSYAVAHVTSAAVWHYGSSGSAADGLGDAYVYVPPANPHEAPGGYSSGEAYELKQVQADGTFDVKLSPSVSTDGTASVGITVDIAPVVLSVGGVTFDGAGNAIILVGQGATGSLTCGIGTISNWQWSVGGSKFASWTVSNDQSTATLSYVPDSTWTTANPHWYWSADQAGISVSCAATLTTPDGVAHSISGNESVKVIAPDWTFKGTPSPNSSYLTTDGFVSGVQANDLEGDPGVAFKGAVGTPSSFSGDGYWQYVQIAAPYRTITDENGNTTSLFPSNTVGLDNDWPYPIFTGDGPPWNAGETDGTPYPHSTEDSPDQEFPITTRGYEVEDQFEMYEMYRPPGNDTQWVPVSDIQWGWSGQQNRGNGNWSNPPLCTIIVDSSVRQTLHPTWTQVLTNG